MIKIYLFCSLLLYPIFIFAQQDSTDSYNLFENLLEENTQDKEDSQIYELFEYLIENPINLNTAVLNELLQIPFLNNSSARKIIRFRNKLGGISSLEQLKQIEGINSGTIEKILPFIKLDEPESIWTLDSITNLFTNTKFLFRSRITRDLQPRTGFCDNHFQGNQQKYLNKLTLNLSNKIRVGLLTEKDAGEKSLIDFTSFHISVKDISYIRNLVIGDYVFEFGQGLAFWNPYGISKGSDAVGTVSRNSRGASPSSSSDENQFLRGASIKFNYEGFSLTSFFSSHNLDATIDSLTNTVKSLSLDGYHRTENEIQSADCLNEKIFGLNAEYNFNDMTKIGLLFYKSKFDHDFSKSYIPKIKTSEFEYSSVCYSTSVKKLLFSGEFAYDKNKIASINNLEFLVDKNFSLVFSYRNFPNNYYSIHANAFGEKGTSQNEIGFYSGLYWRTAYGTINFYYDQFEFPITSNNFEFPSNGNDFLINFSSKLSSKVEMRIRYKNENKDVLTIIDNEYGLSKRRSQKLRAELSYSISKDLRFKTQYETIGISAITGNPKESGYLFYQDARCQLFENLRVHGRIIFFRTDSYYSRLYEFENDLAGVMTNPALFGEGIRWYILVHCKTTFGLNLSLKYSELFKPYERSMGSSYNEIRGNLDNRLSVQLDFQL